MDVLACPFKVGDHVRMKPDRRKNIRYRRGVVKRVDTEFLSAWNEHCYTVRIERDGARKGETYYFSYIHERPGLCGWEPVPACDLSLDETATGLARAVLAGDLEAARVLADRVFDLAGGPA